jgi:uncharacterized protein Smg (DUF494 family)
MDDSVREMVFLIVEQLKAYVDGDEDALLELTQVLDSGRHDADTVNQAFELIFRALEPYAREDFAVDSTSPRQSLRVPTASERAYLDAPGYHYLYALVENGRVSPEQYEEIMARVREDASLLDTETSAKELATSVLIRWFDDEHGVEFDPGNPAWVH